MRQRPSEREDEGRYHNAIKSGLARRADDIGAAQNVGVAETERAGASLAA